MVFKFIWAFNNSFTIISKYPSYDKKPIQILKRVAKRIKERGRV